jgi:hypothetical protein
MLRRKTELLVLGYGYFVGAYQRIGFVRGAKLSRHSIFTNPSTVIVFVGLSRKASVEEEIAGTMPFKNGFLEV